MHVRRAFFDAAHSPSGISPQALLLYAPQVLDWGQCKESAFAQNALHSAEPTTFGSSAKLLSPPLAEQTDGAQISLAERHDPLTQAPTFPWVVPSLHEQSYAGQSLPVTH
jgi:hypothetical protein